MTIICLRVRGIASWWHRSCHQYTCPWDSRGLYFCRTVTFDVPQCSYFMYSFSQNLTLYWLLSGVTLLTRGWGAAGWALVLPGHHFRSPWCTATRWWDSGCFQLSLPCTETLRSSSFLIGSNCGCLCSFQPDLFLHLFILNNFKFLKIEWCTECLDTFYPVSYNS